MKFNTVHAIFFSPTFTSQKVANGIVEGLSAEQVKSTNLTHALCEEVQVASHELAVIAAPVYGGHIAPTAVERLQSVRGNNTPAVLVAVYGNREFNEALTQLHSLAIAQGFLPVAAAAFIGEHSFSTPKTPIAFMRPNSLDIAKAIIFGRTVLKRLEQIDVPEHLPALKISKMPHPRVYLPELPGFILALIRFKINRPEMPLTPVTDAGKCTSCGVCVTSCPVSAIDAADLLHSDASRCIRCCACVKTCPVNARHFYSPFAKILSQNAAHWKKPTWMII